MSDNNIFGQPFSNLPDHVIQVIIDNPAVRTQFAQNQRALHTFDRWKHDRSLRGQVIKWIKVAAGIAPVAVAIKASLSNNPREATSPSHLRKRKAEFITPDTKGTKRKFIEISPDEKGMVRGPKEQEFIDWVHQGDQSMADAGPLEPATTEAASARTAASGGSGRTGQHGETPVSTIPYSKKTPWDKTVQAKLTYYKTFDLTISTAANAVQHCSFRLNSIYDVQRDAAYSDAEVTVASADSSAGDATQQVPTYRDYWMQYYNYWTVVKSGYRIRCYVRPTSANLGTDFDNRDIEVIAYVYHHGAQNPPKYNTGTTAVVPHQIKRDHDGMYFFPLRYDPLSKGISFGDQAQSASGDYTPGSIHHEVGEDELKQTWHKPTEVPPTLEAVTIHFQKSPWAQYGSDVLVRCEITLEYDAQFKDLKTIFQYPTGETDTPAGSNVATQT